MGIVAVTLALTTVISASVAMFWIGGPHAHASQHAAGLLKAASEADAIEVEPARAHEQLVDPATSGRGRGNAGDRGDEGDDDFDDFEDLLEQRLSLAELRLFAAAARLRGVAPHFMRARLEDGRREKPPRV